MRIRDTSALKSWTSYVRLPTSLNAPSSVHATSGALKVATDAWLFPSSLTLPGLEAISVLVWDASVNLLLPLLQRSLPPLRELAIALSEVDLIALDQCLCLVPTVEKFEMWRPNSRLLLDFLCALAESPSLLPRLRNLTLHVHPIYNTDLSACWTALLGALASRRALVRYVRVEVLRYAEKLDGRFRPTDDILSAFRDLTVDGMQLYIGSQDGNLNFI
ncbi:hypothetical protein DFH06DRAFT_626707 [Mycena polygramma]|nr:hypothetical protein DFH06DRAFT_626707 [Mycena polygramma]